MTKQLFQLNPHWRIEQTEKSLNIYGGADAKFLIELASADKSYFDSLKSEKGFSRQNLNEQDQAIFEELLLAEIITPKTTFNKQLKIIQIGDTKLNLAHPKIEHVELESDSDLVIIVRSTSTHVQLIEKLDYHSVIKPNLYIDLAYHHTISIGPLVFPGDTACVACLAGRISKRWGDEKPVANPQVTKDYGGVTEEIVLTELMRLLSGDTSLTNRTVSWNFAERSTRQDQLLKVPLCPTCNNPKHIHSGKLMLPWA